MFTMEAHTPPFLCPKQGIFDGGRTAGRTKWTDKNYELDGQK